MEIDPELERRAFEEAVEGFPSMRPFAAAGKLRFLPLPGGGGAFMVRYEPALSGTIADAWEFQNAVIRAYKRLNGERDAGGCAR